MAGHSSFCAKAFLVYKLVQMVVAPADQKTTAKSGAGRADGERRLHVADGKGFLPGALFLQRQLQEREIVLTADIRVFVCDNHPIVVDGLSWLFRKTGGIELVGSAIWGADTIEIVANAKPDVLFFDYRQLQESCVSPADLRRILRDVKFVVFSAGVTVMETMQALDHGAAGVVLKSAPLHRIEEAVRRVAAGDNFLDEGIARTLAFYSGRPREDGHAGF